MPFNGYNRLVFGFLLNGGSNLAHLIVKLLANFGTRNLGIVTNLQLNRIWSKKATRLKALCLKEKSRA